MGTRATVTIRDVAAACGVSMMTVSRVVRGIDGVSEAVRARVAQAVREMGYVPNGNARALVETGSRLIGISLPNLFNDVFAEVLSGMRHGLEQAGYASVIDTTDYDPARELEWMRRMGVWRPAALVLTGCDHDEGLRTALPPVPVMEIWDVTASPLDICVGIDHRAAALMLGRHVAALGYRRPAFVGMPAGLDRRADARVEGLREAFGGAGARALRRVEVTEASAFAAGAAGLAELGAPPDADVIFFHNDNTAFGGLCAAERAGLRVPGDIGMVGFNGLEIAGVLPQALTTCETPRRRIGLVAAQHLVARLAGVRPPAVTALDCRLVPGATVRAQ